MGADFAALGLAAGRGTEQTGEPLLVDAAVAPLQAEPRAASEQISQTLAGHRVTCVERRDPWLRVRTADRYEGWLHRGYLRRDSDAASAARFAAGRWSLGCIVRERDGRVRALPLGAILPNDATLESGAAVTPAERAARFPRDARAISLSAVELFQGTPYQWGGITPWGADCSGLVQSVFLLHGVALPRDARQQAELGQPAPERVEELEPGDLIFFSDRADGGITHVGIALGGGRMVHLALGRGGYAVEQLVGEGDRDQYVSALRERKRMARRVVGKM